MAPLPTPSAADFLAFFPDHRIQYFDDTPAKDPAKAYGTDRLLPAEAAGKQTQGCGVYFSPNAFEGSRPSDHLKAIQALFLDIDCAKEGDGTPRLQVEAAKQKRLKELLSFRLRPHAIIGTKNGLQPLWRVRPLAPAEGKALFEEAEALLSDLLHGDPATKDLTRVLRVPGYHHLKDPLAPFRCTLLVNDLGREPFHLPDVVSDLQTIAAKRSQTSAVVEQPVQRKGEAASDGASAGGRNEAASSRAGHLLRETPEMAWETQGGHTLRTGTARNTPPLPERELQGVFRSVAGREKKRREQDSQGRHAVGLTTRGSQADRLLGLVTEENGTLFLDQLSTPFASILVAQHRETWPVRSRRSRLWLSSLLWEAEEQAPSTHALASALGVLEARACFGGKRLTLWNRVAIHEGALWYDLGNDGFEAVRVTAEGWDIVSHPPPLFYRYAHQQPQVRPERGGDIRALLPFLNLSEDVPNVLFLTYLVSCFLPDIQHPVPLLYGPHGSAKTTCSWILRALIDPSALQALALPIAVPDLIQLLSHHWFAFFDNVSSLPDWASDLLCRAVTGEGFSKRELYSDDEDVIYAFRRCVGINGVNLAARKPDLLDRSLLIRLERIPATKRKPMRVLAAQFEAARPAILGGIFDILSASLRLGADTQLTDVPRMADFAERGCAIAEALGYGAQAFLDAYAANIREQHLAAVQEHAVAAAILAFMEGQVSWRGSPSSLLAELEKVAFREKINTKARSWPASASAFMRRLNEVKTNLAEVGVEMTQGRLNNRRCIGLSRSPEESERQASLKAPSRAVPGDGMAPKQSEQPSAPPWLPEAESHGRDGSDGLF